MQETLSAKLTDYLNEETIGSFGKKKEKFIRYPLLYATARLSLLKIIRDRIRRVKIKIQNEKITYLFMSMQIWTRLKIQSRHEICFFIFN
jgi:hypothetical protein